MEFEDIAPFTEQNLIIEDEDDDDLPLAKRRCEVWTLAHQWATSPAQSVKCSDDIFVEASSKSNLPFKTNVQTEGSAY